MRTAVFLTAFVATALAVPHFTSISSVKTVTVNKDTASHQYQILELFESFKQIDKYSKYYQVGKDYDIKKNVAQYEHGVVEKFYELYEEDFLPKHYTFSIFDEVIREQALALYDLFYYAKDFETFYNTAAWARVHVNQGMFIYTFYLAMIHRSDTKDLAIPAFYEVVPEFYANNYIFKEMLSAKTQGKPFNEYPEYGIFERDGQYFYYYNYSDYNTYGKHEFKISYLTEDIGFNSFYSYFHALMPFWERGDDLYSGHIKERRGEFYYFFYQQLLARYYLERLTNGLGEIPTFSWHQPFYYGFRPYLSTYKYPFAQRPYNYILQTEDNLDDLRFVRNYEDKFLTFLEEGQFEAFHQYVDFYNTSSINFVGNFWQANPDLFENFGKTYFYRSYEMAARRILGGSSFEPDYQQYEFFPTALSFYQTSLRDPAFYQLYNKIISFIIQYKKYYVQPYSYDKLHFTGVKVRDVDVSRLETFFELRPFNATNALYFNDNDFKYESESFALVQPRLNHEQFKVKISLKSDYEGMATFKIFLGPKYDSFGNEYTLENNWMNFVELDWFAQKITKGDVIVERDSNQFFHFKEDSMHMGGLYELLEQGKLPEDMVKNYYNMPRRLMLPRGTKGGFPLQVFVVVYPESKVPKEHDSFEYRFTNKLPFGFPLDRPVPEYFKQPNMYFEDVFVYHKGSEYPSTYNVEHNYVKNTKNTT